MAQQQQINQCYSSTTIVANALSGGLVGSCDNSTISNSYSLGDVSRSTGTNEYNASFVGAVSGTSILEYCYSKGSVLYNGATPTNKGFVGYQEDTPIFTSNFWDSEVSNQTTAIGATAKTTTEMNTVETFTNSGWDFMGSSNYEIWNIGNSRNNNYPYLSWQYPKDPPIPFSPQIGDGSSNNPYQIASLSNLYWLMLQQNNSDNIGPYWSRNYIQTISLNAQSSKILDTLRGFIPIGNQTIKFNGNYNGQGNAIDSLFINRPAEDFVGLFGYAEFGSITNVSLINVDITGKDHVGGLIGRGAIVQVSKCLSTGEIVGSNYVGGLFGHLYGSTITNSYSKGSVTRSDASTETNIGAFTGKISGGSIQHCYSTSLVSYATGNNSTDKGFVGFQEGYPTYTNNFWDSQTTGQSTAVGAIMRNTIEMNELVTFIGVGWDFKGQGEDDIWNIGNGRNNRYPYLNNQFPNDPALTSPFPAKPTVGNGNSSSPYQIATFENFYWLTLVQNHTSYSGPLCWSQYYKQTADIDVSAASILNNNKGIAVIGNDTVKFTGSYNGQNFVLDNLVINRPTEDNIGLFGYTNNATISKVGIINSNITGNNNVGSIAGKIGTASTISQCFSSGNIVANALSGGLVGSCDSSIISNCYTLGDVNRSTGANEHNGAFAGAISSSSTVEYCYSTGSVLYNEGNPTSKGFVGYQDGTSIFTSNFWDSEVSNQATSIGATAKTTAEMNDKLTFISNNWIFTGQGSSNIWNIGNGRNNDYPYFDWQFPDDPALTLIMIVPQGDGSEDSPYLIASINNLYWLTQQQDNSDAEGLYWNRHYKQTANITATTTNTWDGGSGVLQIGNTTQRFMGEYNGQGYTIDGLSINRSNTNAVGLFGFVYYATIKDLGTTNVNITGEDVVGGLIGASYNSNIFNNFSTGSVTGNNDVGGFVGIVGISDNIKYNYSNCNVTGKSGVGGFAGWCLNVTIDNNYSMGNIVRSNSSDSNLGAFIGIIDGSASSTTIENCYATGSVTYSDGDNPTNKGFVGNQGASQIYTSNFWDSEVSNQTTAIGATGKTTALMNKRETFTDASWLFKGQEDGIWNIANNRNSEYPYFDWQSPNDPTVFANNCLYFDGIVDFVEVNQAVIPNSGDFAISLWAKADLLQDGARALFSQSPFYFGKDSNGGFRIGDWTPANLVFPLDNTWHFYTIVKNSSNTWFYIDGVLRATRGSTTNNPTGTQFRIGRQFETAEEYFKGNIDEIRIWNTTLSLEQIRANMYKELVGTEAGLVAYFNFNETYGAALTDKTSNSFSGTRYGNDTTTWQTSSAFAGPKDCINFDGVDDYVEVNQAVMPLSGDFTVSVWAKANPVQDSYREIFSHGHFYLGKSADNKIRVGDTWGNAEVNFPLDNIWHFYTIVKNSSNTLLYIDGILAATKGSAIANPDGAQFRIGRQYGPYGEYFKGEIDEIRIWNDVRTPDEIRQNMNNTLVGNEEGLLTYYNFDNSTDNTLQDFGTGAKDGNLINMDNTAWVNSQTFNTWLNVNTINYGASNNWSRGVVPVAIDNVGIKYYTNGSKPIIDTDVLCNNLVIGFGSKLSISNSLTATGNVFNEGALLINGTFVNTGATSVTINNGGFNIIGVATFNNLINNPNKTITLQRSSVLTILE